MRTAARAIGAGLAIGAVAVSGVRAQRSRAPVVRALAPTVRAATDTTAMLSFRAFGIDFLFRAMRDDGAAQNTVVSPVSAASMLSLLWMGARAGTADSLAAALGLAGLDRADVARKNAAFMESVAGRADVTLQVANAVWLNTPYQPGVEFARIADSAYRAEVSQAPLSSPAVVPLVNQWADSATHGKIRSILDHPLPANAVMLLANAVYFRGKWTRPFDTAQTRDGDFHLADGAVVRVPFMEGVRFAAYARRPGYQLLRLPYGEGHTAMYVVLPDSGESVADLQRHLRSTGWPAFAPGQGYQDVRVALPRFHVEQKLELNSILSAIGFGIAFDPRRADLSGLVREQAPGRLYVSRATQKVFIDVDEQGTTAAAVTTGGVVATAVHAAPLRFIVDRPFLFIVRDEVSGSDLFAGWIAHP